MLNKRKFPRLDEEWEFTYHVLNKDQFIDDPICQYTVNIRGREICFKANEDILEDTMLAIDLESEEFPAFMLVLTGVV